MNPLHSRVDLACEQLDVAIELFFSSRSFVSSLTLAGAAEEIFGVEVENIGGKSTLTRRYEQRLKVSKKLEDKTLYPSVVFNLQTQSVFRDKLNYARNAAKHIASKKSPRWTYDQFFRVNPKDASVAMILRALHNQELLALPRSELGHKFYGWHLSETYSSEPGEP